MDLFRELTTCRVGTSISIFLWKDKWDTDIMMRKYPELYSFTLDENIYVSKAIEIQNIYDLFQLPFSIIAHHQLHQLSDQLIQVRNTGNRDSWNLPWGNAYSTKKVYNSLVGPTTPPPPFKRIWKCYTLPKHKFFCWLLLHDRNNICDLLTKKTFHQDSTSCALCYGCPMEDCPMEDRLHLFFWMLFQLRFLVEYWN